MCRRKGLLSVRAPAAACDATVDGLGAIVRSCGDAVCHGARDGFKRRAHQYPRVLDGRVGVAAFVYDPKHSAGMASERAHIQFQLQGVARHVRHG